MTIEFQFTREDYLDAYRAHFRKGASLFSRLLLKAPPLSGGCLLIGMGVFLVAVGERRLNVWLVPAALGAFWIWIGIGGTYKRAAKVQFEKSPALRQPRRVEFTAEGIETDAGVASSDVNWKAYRVMWNQTKSSCCTPLPVVCDHPQSGSCSPGREKN